MRSWKLYLHNGGAVVTVAWSVCDCMASMNHLRSSSVIWRLAFGSLEWSCCWMDHSNSPAHMMRELCTPVQSFTEINGHWRRIFGVSTRCLLSFEVGSPHTSHTSRSYPLQEESSTGGQKAIGSLRQKVTPGNIDENVIIKMAGPVPFQSG